MKLAQKLACASAITCFFCIVGSYWVMLYCFPQFWTSLEGRLNVFHNHTVFIQLWFFTAWIVFGIGVVVFNYTLFKSAYPQKRYFDFFITLASYVSGCYCVSIGVIEMLSVYSVVEHGVELDESTNTSINYFYHILVKLRGTTEFSADIWLFLVNVWLLLRTSVPKLLPLLGIATVLTGFSIVLFQLPELALPYVHLHGGWFLSMGIWVITVKQIAQSSEK